MRNADLIMQLDKPTGGTVKVWRYNSGKARGLVVIGDGGVGLGHSCHPCIDSTGSVAGMKDRGWCEKHDHVVDAFGFKWNVDKFSARSGLDWVAAELCYCQGEHERLDLSDFERAQLVHMLLKGNWQHYDRRGKPWPKKFWANTLDRLDRFGLIDLFGLTSAGTLYAQIYAVTVGANL